MSFGIYQNRKIYHRDFDVRVFLDCERKYFIFLTTVRTHSEKHKNCATVAVTTLPMIQSLSRAEETDTVFFFLYESETDRETVLNLFIAKKISQLFCASTSIFLDPLPDSFLKNRPFELCSRCAINNIHAKCF